MAVEEAWWPRRRRPPSGVGAMVEQPQSAVGPVAAEQRPAEQIGEGGVGSVDPLLSADPRARGRGGSHGRYGLGLRAGPC